LGLQFTLMSNSAPVLHRLLRWYRPFFPSFGLAGLLMVVVALCDGSLVFLIEHVLDDGLIAQNEQALQAIPFLLVGLYVAKGVGRAGVGFLLNRAGFGVAKALRSEVFAHLLRQEMPWHKAAPTAEIVSRVSSDVSEVDGLAHSLTGVFEKPLTILVLLGSAVWMDWRLSLAVLGVLPLIAVATLGFAGQQRRTTQTVLDSRAEFSQRMQESLDGIAEIQAFGAEADRLAAFQVENERQRKHRFQEAMARFLPGPIVEILAAVGIGVVIAYGAHRVLAGVLLPGELMAFLVAFGLLNQPLKGLAQVSANLQRARVGAQAAFGILDRVPRVLGGTHVLQTTQCQLTFDSVSIDFGEGPVLSQVSFQVGPGERLAIVGPSGAGKTSLLAVLPRFLDPTQGQVLLNNKPLADYTLESLRRHIAWVGQDTALFQGTVAENLRLGRADATQADLVAACQRAQAHAFIQALPQGYETPVGPRGSRLSGGQAQRIAIARALVKDAPILLLDEATSSLDKPNERAVLLAIEALMADRTTLVVSHRLQTIQKAEAILLLGDGGVLALGSHQDLLGDSAAYRQLLGAR
jgi:subfamily B ATP-binding cassette protein MsbA